MARISSLVLLVACPVAAMFGTRFIGWQKVQQATRVNRTRTIEKGTLVASCY